MVFSKLQNDKININFQDISKQYRTIAKNIKPSYIIEKYIPKNIHKYYGIHLRKTDKVGEK